MAQKKRPTKKRKKTKKTKKQKQQQEQMLTIGVGFTLILFAVFGFLKLGFLGILIANGFRIIAGNTYQILCLFFSLLQCSWLVVWLINSKKLEPPAEPFHRVQQPAVFLQFEMQVVAGGRPRASDLSDALSDTYRFAFPYKDPAHVRI